MTPNEMLKRLLDRELSLRDLSRTTGINRDKIYKGVMNIATEDEKKQLKEVLLENKRKGKIKIDDKLKKILIQILKGEITVNEASKIMKMDKETLRRKAEELANSSPEYIKYYIRYKSKIGDYSGINFRRIFIEIIENNLSQTEIAKEYEIPTRTISRELEKIGKSDDENDLKLHDLAKIYAEKKMKHQKMNTYELRLYSKLIDDIKKNSNFLTIEDEDPFEKNIKELTEFKNTVKTLKEKGLTDKQVADELQIGVSTIRRRILKLKELETIKKGKEQEETKKIREEKMNENERE